MVCADFFFLQFLPLLFMHKNVVEEINGNRINVHDTVIVRMPKHKITILNNDGCEQQHFHPYNFFFPLAIARYTLSQLV